IGFYPVEGSITGGLCTISIGGAGNIAILSASNLMNLFPYAQIATRIGGALIVFISAFTYPIFYS
ncbi:MAG: 2-hydroxycarboxylate transporter family protein, partial [Candidatus Phytoplasma australasiaticum]|nr:2-hydroxycarboxylate transporter family protein [Candidatus Phytoplasma australasiaticum]